VGKGGAVEGGDGHDAAVGEVVDDLADEVLLADVEGAAGGVEEGAGGGGGRGRRGCG
jgi:hypothetical protein